MPGWLRDECPCGSSPLASRCSPHAAASHRVQQPSLGLASDVNQLETTFKCASPMQVLKLLRAWSSKHWKEPDTNTSARSLPKGARFIRKMCHRIRCRADTREVPSVQRIGGVSGNFGPRYAIQEGSEVDAPWRLVSQGCCPKATGWNASA